MNICVYCGSSEGNHSSILEAVKEFGECLAEHHIRLIYGGSSIGIMGCLANSVMNSGGEVTGVIPQGLFRKEVAHEGITELITVADMHERKSTMANLADAFVALPGGFGTLEELFEIITWNQIGIFNKQVVIYNINGFYDSLISMIDQSVGAGFIQPKNRNIVKIAETAEQCLRFCKVL